MLAALFVADKHVLRRFAQEGVWPLAIAQGMNIKTSVEGLHVQTECVAM